MRRGPRSARWAWGPASGPERAPETADIERMLSWTGRELRAERMLAWYRSRRACATILARPPGLN